jgi:hypothetical protein
MRLLGSAFLLVSALNAGVILDVSDGSGPGGTPSPHSVTTLPYGIELVLTGAGSDNGCVDAAGSNPTCWYQNNTGFDWVDLIITASVTEDITCGGDVFGTCQSQGNVVRLAAGRIDVGEDFHFDLSGWSPGTTLTIEAVPEPASVMFVLGGVGMLALMRVRTRRAAQRR